MATRALLYRRPAEPSTLVVRHGSQFFSVKLRRHRRARRYTLRIHPTDREAILTMPPRGTIAEAKEFAQHAWRLDRRPSRPFAEGGAVPARHGGPAARRRRTGSCIVPASAARCGRKRATAARRSSASPGMSSIPIAACTTSSSARRARICGKAAQLYADASACEVKRVSIRDQSSRWGSCTSAGSLSFSWRLILAPPYRARLSRRPRSRASRRDEPFGAVLAGRGQGMRSCRARQKLARHPRQRSAPLRDRGLQRGPTPLPARCAHPGHTPSPTAEQPVHQPAVQPCCRFRTRR